MGPGRNMARIPVGCHQALTLLSKIPRPTQRLGRVVRNESEMRDRQISWYYPFACVRRIPGFRN